MNLGVKKVLEYVIGGQLKIRFFTCDEMEYIDNFYLDNVNVKCHFMYSSGQYCCYLLNNRGKSRLNCVVSRCMCVKMLPCCCYEVRSN